VHLHTLPNLQRSVFFGQGGRSHVFGMAGAGKLPDGQGRIGVILPSLFASLWKQEKK
jgi:hypothetical protein